MTVVKKHIPAGQITTRKSARMVVPLHEQSNYLKVLPGGHCFFCHEDFPQDHDFDKCRVERGIEPNGSTPCTDTCKGSKFYTPNFPQWVKKNA